MRVYSVQRGFTLLEVMIAFTIAALLIGLSSPIAMRMYDSMKYREAVRSVITGIQSTRYIAMTQGEVTGFRVTPEKRQFQVASQEKVQLSDTIFLKITSARELNDHEETGVIRFYPDGSSSGGTIELTHTSGRAVQLQVGWLLGKLTQKSYASE